MSLPIIPLLLAGGAAIFLLSSSKPKKYGTTTKNGNGSDSNKSEKGFKIIEPCVKYEIINKPKSYEYAYQQAIKEIDRAQKEKMVFSIGNVFQNVLKCRLFETDENVTLIYSSEYYSWIYFLYRSVSKALVDRKLSTIESANMDLDMYKKNLATNGLDSSALPTLW